MLPFTVVRWAVGPDALRLRSPATVVVTRGDERIEIAGMVTMIGTSHGQIRTLEIQGKCLALGDVVIDVRETHAMVDDDELGVARASGWSPTPPGHATAWRTSEPSP